MNTLQANDNIVRAIREEKRLYFSFTGYTRRPMVELTSRVILPSFERERLRDYFIYKPRRSFTVSAIAKGTMTHMAFWESAETRNALGFMSATMGDPKVECGDLIEPIFSVRIDIARFLQLEGQC